MGTATNTLVSRICLWRSSSFGQFCDFFLLPLRLSCLAFSKRQTHSTLETHCDMSLRNYLCDQVWIMNANERFSLNFWHDFGYTLVYIGIESLNTIHNLMRSSLETKIQMLAIVTGIWQDRPIMWKLKSSNNLRMILGQSIDLVGQSRRARGNPFNCINHQSN
jgi:hypothetical protein